MARPISDEELQLKRRARRRLIGAIVLVTAVVVALPMVLDSEPKPVSGEITLKIPSPDSGAFTSRVVPVNPGTSQAPAPAGKLSTEMKSAPQVAAVPAEKKASPPEKKAPAPESKAPPLPAGKAIAQLPDPPPAARTEAAPAPPAPKKPPESTPAAKPAPSGFVVQVIALADVAKAKQVQAQIAGAGIKAYTEVVKTAKGDVTRVRAGPFPTRAAAEKARDQLKAIGLSGNVVPPTAK
jgi:DedD protein